jgi:cell wall-associated NlpC family hydrolase
LHKGEKVSNIEIELYLLSARMVLMKRFRILIIILLILLAFGCVKAPEVIKDIRDLKQDHMSYIEAAASAREMVSSHDQEIMDRRYNELFFAPWHQTGPQYLLDQLKNTFHKYEKNPGFGENSRKHKKKWIRKLLANAQLDNYPNAGFMAITIDNADLRVLPTYKPSFISFNYLHRGYPFDRLQESLIAANTPLFISHMTRDKAWVLAETPYAIGWLQSTHVALVDADFIKAWERGQYAVIIKDKTPVYDDQRKFLFESSLGSLFPAMEEKGESIKVLVAVADINKRAVIRNATVLKETAVLKPLKMTPLNLARMANELIDEPYGWGGMYGNRDCSAMIKDLFAPFGLWLPRNSADQAREGGTFIDLQNLSPEEKEGMIVKRGIPYLTLIWKKGHIMLYIGNQQGKALVFHNFWSVQTISMLGRRERTIVGHAAITTLHPGMELYNTDSLKDDYLNGVLGMTLLINNSKRGDSQQ